jgi:hypothetical protein
MGGQRRDGLPRHLGYSGSLLRWPHWDWYPVGAPVAHRVGECDVIVRTVLIAFLLCVCGWCWYRGEHTIRQRLAVPDPYEPIVGMFIGMWRLLMLAVTAVAVISSLGLWWSQNAATAAKQVTENLCESTVRWQQEALAARVADVRIAEGELADARQEQSDATRAVETAEVSGEYANAFVRQFLDAEINRAGLRVASLETELDQRRKNLENLSGAAQPGCPPPESVDQEDQ